MLRRKEEIRQLATPSRADSFNLALKFNTLSVGAYLFCFALGFFIVGHQTARIPPSPVSPLVIPALLYPDIAVLYEIPTRI